MGLVKKKKKKKKINLSQDEIHSAVERRLYTLFTETGRLSGWITNLVRCRRVCGNTEQGDTLLNRSVCVQYTMSKKLTHTSVELPSSSYCLHGQLP